MSYAPYSNICPISGWTGANVTRTGKNRIQSIATYSDDASMVRLYGSSGGFPRLTTPKLAAGTYTLSLLCKKGNASNTDSIRIWYKSIGGNIVGGNGGEFAFPALTLTDNYQRISKTFVLPVDCEQIILGYYSSGNYVLCDTNSIMLQPGSVVDEYEPFGTTIPISWQSEAGTVYGGTLDVTSGVLTVDRAAKVYDGTETGWRIAATGTSNWFYENEVSTGMKSGASVVISNKYPFASVGASNTEQGVCFGGNYAYVRIRWGSEDTLDNFKASLISVPLVVVGYLVQPQTYQLDPVTVTTLLGQNNIWADTGNVSITDGGYLTRVIEHVDSLEESLGFYYDKDV